MSTQKWKNGESGSALGVITKLDKPSNRITGVMSDGTVVVELNTSKRSVNINAELVKFLSSVFHLKQDQIEIVAGEEQQKKLISLLGVDPHNVEKMINEAIA